MIRGINLLKEFDIELNMLETESKPVQMRGISVNSADNIIDHSYKNELINRMVKEFKDIFVKHKWDIRKTNVVKLKRLTNSKPIVINPCWQLYHLIKKIEKSFREMKD